MWRALGLLSCWIVAVLALTAELSAEAPTQNTTQNAALNIVVLGDLPYRNKRKTLLRYDQLIARINDLKPDLVIHVGDTKSGGSRCTDKILRQRLNDLDKFDAPTLYTPGDNEWTDCHRNKAGDNDPLERLSFLRREYFATPDQSFGQNPVRLDTQADDGYPENVRLRMGRVLVITAHVVGSNNNASNDTKDKLRAIEEFRTCQAATIRWLDESFAQAKDADHIIVAIHANMFLVTGFVPGFETFIGNSGYRKFALRLAELAHDFGKPVLLLHGDTHFFHSYQPFKSRAPNLTVLETFGHPDINAVQVLVATNAQDPYRITPVLPVASDK